MKPRRTAYEIVWKILEYCKEPRRLTQIMQGCNLNTPTANRYVDLLVHKNMLTINEECYKTTKEGLKYIELIEEAYLTLF